jgi:DNA (cytosine-5)-methyltransferase 1
MKVLEDQNIISISLIFLYSKFVINMNKVSKFTFIDLFAGIGGIRIGFEKAGGECVFSSEYDKFSQITYKAFFEDKPDFSEIKEVDPPGDITKLHPKMVPDHDILTGGFPCQPFSLAGIY